MAAARRGWRRHRQAAAFVAGVLLGLYVASYALLYRRSVAELRGSDDFIFYVPVADVLENWELPTQHLVLKELYAPLNSTHHRLLGGREACSGMSCGTRP